MLSNLDISYGGALLQVPLKKITDKNGNAVNIQPFTDKGGQNVYLWSSPMNEINDGLIYDIQIIYNNEPIPTDYIKIQRDITAGHGTTKAYICYLTGKLTSTNKEKKPIADVMLVSADEPLEPGYTRLSRPLYPEGKSWYIAISYASDNDLQSAITDIQWLESLKINDSIDILSNDKIWRLGKIISIHSTGKTFQVSYNGWSAAFNEDIPRSLKRVAKAGSQTAGKDTGNASRQGTAFSFDIEQLVAYEKKVRMLINNEYPEEQKDTFCKAELPQFVFDVMSSKYSQGATYTDTNGETITLDVEEARDRVNEFNLLMLQYIAKQLNNVHQPLPPEILQHLQRYFLLDDQCNYFYDYHGFMNSLDENAHKYIGFAAAFASPHSKQSKFWVANINAFYKYGGLDAIIERIEYHVQQCKKTTTTSTSSSTNSSPTSSNISNGTEAWNDINAASELLILVKAICNMRVVVTKDWGAKYFTRYRDSFFQRLNTLTENQLKKISVDDLSRVITSIRDFGDRLVTKADHDDECIRKIIMGPDYTGTGPTEDNVVAFDQQNLDFSIHLLTMEGLVLRLKGLTDLNKYVHQIFSFSSNDPYSIATGKNRKPAINAIKVLQTLRDKKVINILFGGEFSSQRLPLAPHVQLLTRLGTRDSFIMYIAKEGSIGENSTNPELNNTGFTKEHLTLLCNLFRKEIDDSGIRHALLDILQQIGKYLEREFHDQLYQFLCTIPRHVYDIQLVKSMSFLTREAIESYRLEVEASYRDLESLNSQETKTVTTTSTSGTNTITTTTVTTFSNNGSNSTSKKWELPEDIKVIQNNKDDFHHWYTLPQLWAMTLDTAPEYATINQMNPIVPKSTSSYANTLPSMETLDTAQSCLLDMLLNIDAEQRTITVRLASMAAESIAKGTANYSTVRMLNRLLREIPTTPGNYRKFTQESIMNNLQQQYKICEALVKDIQHYKNLAVIEAQKRGISLTTSTSSTSITSTKSTSTPNKSTEAVSSVASLDDTKGTIFVGRHNHIEQLLSRLTLLSFFAKNKDSSFQFSADHIDTLWTSLVENAINVDEVEMFFDWLQKTINGGMIPIEQSNIVFDRCFCGKTPRLSTEKLGLKGYECFYALFRQVNIDNKKVQMDYLNQLYTIDPQLNGLSTLWNIVLSNENENVASEASTTLVHLHSHLEMPWSKADNSTVLTRQEVWKQFITECIKIIQDLLPSSSSSSLILRNLSRVLRLLQDFLTELDILATQYSKPKRILNKTLIPTDYDFPFPENWKRGNDIFYQPVTAVIIERQMYKTSYSAPISLVFRIRKGIDTIGMLRDRASEYLDRPANKLLFCIKPTNIPRDIQYLKDDIKLMEITTKLYIEESLDTSNNEFTTHEYRKESERISGFLKGMTALLDKQGFQGITIDNLYEQLDDCQLDHINYYESAKRLIANTPALFDTLFDLLSIKDSTIVNQLWSLINITLPIPSTLQQDILTLHGTYPSNGAINQSIPWDTVLGGKSLMHLHYKLSIVKLLLDSEVEVIEMQMKDKDTISLNDSTNTNNHLPIPYNSSGVAEITLGWSKAFVKYGGLQYLYSLIMTVPLSQFFSSDSSSKLQRECAAELLSIFSTFLVGPSFMLRYFNDNNIDLFRVDRNKLLTRMLEWLSYVTTFELPQSTESNTSNTSDKSSNVTRSAQSTVSSDSSKNVNGAASTPTTPNRLSNTKNDTGSSSANKSTPGSAKSSPARSPIGRGRLQTNKPHTSPNAKSNDTKTDTNESTNKKAENPTNNTNDDDDTLFVSEVSIVGSLWNIIIACMLGNDVSAYEPHPRYNIDIHGIQDIPTEPSELLLSLTAVEQFTTFPSIGQVLATALCAPSNAAVRQHVVKQLYGLLNLADHYAHHINNPNYDVHQKLRLSILGILMDNLRITYAFPNTGYHYYGLISLLLPQHIDPVPQLLPMDELVLMEKLVTMLRLHPIVEVGSDINDITDFTLVGLLRIITAVLRGRTFLKKVAGASTNTKIPSLTNPNVTISGLGLVDEIFDTCLFTLCSPEQITDEDTSIPSVLGGKLPKCKQDETRNAALSVLIELSKDCVENSVYMCRKFMPHHDARETTSNVSHTTAGTKSSSSSSDSSVSMDIFATSNASATLEIDNDKKQPTSKDLVNDNKDKLDTLTNRNSKFISARNSTGYVGIRNLGCICYMNSTIQQLFMTPGFRRGVLSYKEPSNMTDAERADNIMYQLQRQFAYLQETEKEYYNPRALCRSIKDWNGNPINVFEQKDVPEFLTKLFADLESQLQGQPLATLAKDVYGGQQLQELIADDPRGSERPQLYTAREEDFHFLQVRVKGYKNVQEALAAYVAGEMVEYKWKLPEDAASKKETDEPGSKNSNSTNATGTTTPAPPKEETLKTNKRVSIKGVGDHLMLHLNRFDFDLNRMEQVKLNDRFEFPPVLDMYPFTVYARDETDIAHTSNLNNLDTKPNRSEFIFDLVGVVIHKGVASAGHYYSYIRERGVNGPVPGDRWYEFNDETVSPWAGEERLESDCFGGKEVVRTVNFWGNIYENEFTHSDNAFCLFYDRRKPESAMHNSSTRNELTLTNSTANATSIDCTVTTSSTKGGFTTVPQPALITVPTDTLPLFYNRIKDSYKGGSNSIQKSVRAPVPSALLRIIQSENMEFKRYLYIYTKQYARSILDIVRNFAIEAKQLTSSGTDSSFTAYSYPWNNTSLPTAREIASSGHPGIVGLRLSITYLLRTLSDPSHPDGITQQDWEPVIHTLLTISPIAPIWFLQMLLDSKSNLINVLLENTHISNHSTKQLLSKLIIQALQVLWPIENTPSLTNTKMDNPTTPTNTTGIRPGKLCLTMIDFLLERLPTVYRYYSRGGFESYFSILLAFANIDYEARQYLITKRVIAKLVDILLCSRSPFPDINKEPNDDKNKKLGSTSIDLKNINNRKEKTLNNWSDEDEGIYSQKRTSSLNKSSSINSTSSTSNITTNGLPQDLRTIDIWDVADMVYDLKSLFQLLRILIFTCLPLSNRSDAPQLQIYGKGNQSLPLHTIDRRFITHWEFWNLYYVSRLFRLGDRFDMRKVTYDNISPLLQHLLYGLEPVPINVHEVPIEKGARMRYEVEGSGDYHGNANDIPEFANMFMLNNGTSSSSTTLNSKIITFGKDKEKQKERELEKEKEKEKDTLTKINYGTPGNFLSILMGIIRYYLRTKGDDQLFGPLDGIENFLKYKDDDQDIYTKRCEFILHHFNLEMKINSLLYRDTEICLLQLMRWGEKYPVVRYWCSDDWNRLSWAETWLLTNTEPPPDTNIANEQGMKLTKEKPRMDSWNVYSRPLKIHVPERHPDLYNNIRRLRRNLRLAHRFVDFETDNIFSYVGRIINANASDAKREPYPFDGVISRVYTEGTGMQEQYKFSIQPLSGGANQNLLIRTHGYYYYIHPVPGEEAGDPDVWDKENKEWIDKFTADHKNNDITNNNSSNAVTIENNQSTSREMKSIPVNQLSPEELDMEPIEKTYHPSIIDDDDDEYARHVGFDVQSDDEEDIDEDIPSIVATGTSLGTKARSPPPVPIISLPEDDDGNDSDNAQVDDIDNQSQDLENSDNEENQDIVDSDGKPIFSSNPIIEDSSKSSKVSFSSLKFGSSASGGSVSSGKSLTNFTSLGSKGILKAGLSNSSSGSTESNPGSPPTSFQFSIGASSTKKSTGSGISKAKSPRRVNSTGKK